jgi:lysophospholipase L1-like esterase
VPAERYAAIRTAQKDIIARDPHTYLGAKTTDILGHNSDSNPDNVHFTNKEYGIIADRLADTVADILIA